MSPPQAENFGEFWAMLTGKRFKTDSFGSKNISPTPLVGRSSRLICPDAKKRRKKRRIFQPLKKASICLHPKASKPLKKASKKKGLIQYILKSIKHYFMYLFVQIFCERLQKYMLFSGTHWSPVEPYYSVRTNLESKIQSVAKETSHTVKGWFYLITPPPLPKRGMYQ